MQTPRPDGRRADQLRPFSIQLDFTEVPDASVLVRAGSTMVWCSACVEDEIPRWMKAQKISKGWVTAEYEMLPGSTNPRSRREGRRGGVGGRTQEIQRLIGRSLRAVTDLEALGERTISLDCDVLQADGGTRTAAITGAFVALAHACGKLVDAGKLKKMPFRDTVAAVSAGVVGGAAVLDLPYVEDSAADVDMNIIMTGAGKFVELQGTGEEAVFDEDELASLLRLGRVGIAELTRIQRDALPNTPTYRDIFPADL